MFNPSYFSYLLLVKDNTAFSMCEQFRSFYYNVFDKMCPKQSRSILWSCV